MHLLQLSQQRKMKGFVSTVGKRKEKPGFISKPEKKCFVSVSDAWILFKISQNTKAGNYIINHYLAQSLRLTRSLKSREN